MMTALIGLCVLALGLNALLNRPAATPIGETEELQLTAFDLEVPDRGEVSIAAAGAESPYFFTAPVFNDLD